MSMSLSLGVGQTSVATLSKGGGFNLDAFMAAQSDGLYNRFDLTDRLFQDTSGTIPANDPGEVVGLAMSQRTWNGRTFQLMLDQYGSVGAIPGKHGTQATLSFRPKYQTGGGAAFDGIDDNLLTSYTAGAGPNFIVAKVTVPASLTDTQYVAGAASGSTDRFRLGFKNSGVLDVALGNVLSISGTNDLRGQTVTVGFSCDGATVRLFEADTQILSQAQSGIPTGTIPLRIGSNNQGGGAGNFFGGTIQSLVAGREFIDLARFKQIASKL